MSSQPPPPHQPLSSRPELPEGVAAADATRGDRGGRLPHWPAWTPLAGLVLVVVSATVAIVAVGALAQLVGIQMEPGELPSEVLIGGTVVQQLAFVVVAVLLARIYAGDATAADFGIRRTPLLPALGWSALTWFGFLAFSAAWAAAVDIGEPDQLPDQLELGAQESVLILISLTIMVTLLAPIAEEFFFRGFCFTAFRRVMGVAGAAVVSGAIFGVIHFPGTEAHFLVPLGVFGALLCLLYWRTGSIIPCVVLHALNNSIALGVALEWEPEAIAGTMVGSIALVLAICLPLTGREPSPSVTAR